MYYGYLQDRSAMEEYLRWGSPEGPPVAYVQKIDPAGNTRFHKVVEEDWSETFEIGKGVLIPENPLPIQARADTPLQFLYQEQQPLILPDIETPFTSTAKQPISKKDVWGLMKNMADITAVLGHFPHTGQASEAERAVWEQFNNPAPIPRHEHIGKLFTHTPNPKSITRALDQWNAPRWTTNGISTTYLNETSEEKNQMIEDFIHGIYPPLNTMDKYSTYLLHRDPAIKYF